MENTPFIREIKDQPAALRSVVAYYSTGAGQSTLEQAVRVVKNAGKLIFTGMGTSRHAALSVRNELVSSVPSCEIWDAGELLHFGLGTVREDSVVFAISQSGESAETRAVIKTLAKKCIVIGMVNDPDSFIGKHADITLLMKAGNEVSISNKTYTNTIAVLQMISGSLSGMPAGITFNGLLQTADLMESSLDESAGQAIRTALLFKHMDSLHIIARGRDLATAEQWSLILKEGASISGQGMSAGLFRHGPIELGGPDLTIACIASSDTFPDLTIALGEELSALGSTVVLISDKTYATKLTQIVLPAPAPRYFPLTCAPFIELFVHESAKLCDRTAGVFTHAVKVTDRE